MISGQPDAPSTELSPRRGAAPVRWWQTSTAASGLLLAFTFFLPAVKSCNGKPDIPAQEWLKLLGESTLSFGKISGCVILYGVAYLCGALLAAGALCRLLQPPPAVGRAARVGIAACLFFCASVALWFFFADTASLKKAFALNSHLLLLPMSFLPGTYLFLSRRMKENAYLVQSFITSLLLLSWFSFWMHEDALYGLYLSWLGSLGLLVSTVGEAGALFGLSPFQALRHLLVCRPQGGVRAPPAGL
jgi:hypothetical protein